VSGGHLHTGVAGDPHSPIHRLDPRAKLLGLTGITLVAVSTSRPAVHGACALALAAVAVAARIPPRTLASRARIVIPALLFVALLIPLHGVTAFATVAPKALLGTSSAVLLSATTGFPDILHALERLHAPRLLVLIAAFMYRYLFTIVDETTRMRAALTARGYAPRHALQAQALGRVATALFLRTYDRAERVHLAMLARGWREQMPRLHALAFRRADALFLAALAAPLLAVRIAA